MSILFRTFDPLRSSPLASPDPLATELTPTSSYRTPYTPGAAYGQVASAPGNTAAYMTVGWQPRRGTTDLPFLVEDALVGAGANDPVPPVDPGPGGGGAPGPGAAPGTTPGTGGVVTPAPGGSAQLRPAVPPTVVVAASRLRTNFVTSGLGVRVRVPADARVTVLLTHTAKQRRRGRRIERVTRKLSRTTVRRRVRAGVTTTITARSSSVGRRFLAGRRRAVTAKLEVVVRYTDRTSVRVVREIALTPPRRHARTTR